MTKSILHHLKKLLRVGVVATVVAGSTVNASAQDFFTNKCEVKQQIQINLEIEKSSDLAWIKE